MLDQIKDKEYSKLFSKSFHVVDLTDDKEFKKLISNIFKYK